MDEELLFIIILLLLAVAIASLVQVFKLKRLMRAVQRELGQLPERLAKLRAPPEGALPAPAQPVKPKAVAASVSSAQPAAPPMPAAPVVPPASPIPAAAVLPPPASIRPQAPPPAPRAPEAAAPAVAPPPEPSAVTLSVREILRRIWRWILVGEETRRPGVTMESAVAWTWLMRIGIMVIVMCVGYFLKWSIERELIGPMGRVGLSVLAGVGLLVWGGVLQGKPRWTILGQGFTGGGLAVLYFSMFAAGPLYKLLPLEATFALMILVTLTAGVLALVTRSLLVAIFGIIGGFCTPLMLQTGEPHFLTLYSYMLLLDAGILAIAHFRQWRLLNYLGFLFTYALYGASLAHYRADRDFTVALVFLSLFFLIQSLLVYLYNIRRALRSTVLEILHLVANAAVYSAAAYPLIRDARGLPYPAIMTVALAVFFILQVALFVRLRLVDRPLLVALLALAGLFTAVSMPIVMEKESLTISWSLLAFMFLWLGNRLDSRFIRHLGHLMYVLVFGRLVIFDFRRDFSDLPAPPQSMALYGRALASRLWTFGVAIGAVFGAFWLERRRQAAPPPRPLIAPGNDTPEFVPASVAGQVFFWGVLVFLFVFLQLEFSAMLAFFTPLRPAVLTALWCGLAAFFLYLIRRDYSPLMLVAAALLLLIAAVKTLQDMAVWQLADRLCYQIEYSLLYVAMRWLDFAGVLAVLAAGWYLLVADREPLARGMARVFGYAGLALLFIYLSLELNSLLYWKLREFQAGGISVLWTLFALGFVAGGIWRQVAPLRYVGLLLFAVVIAKVLFSDLAHMPVIFKALALLAVGILLLLGSFAYLAAQKQFVKETPDT
jgi:uncharacterized membrane protein